MCRGVYQLNRILWPKSRTPSVTACPCCPLCWGGEVVKQLAASRIPVTSSSLDGRECREWAEAARDTSSQEGCPRAACRPQQPHPLHGHLLRWQVPRKTRLALWAGGRFGCVVCACDHCLHPHRPLATVASLFSFGRPRAASTCTPSQDIGTPCR